MVSISTGVRKGELLRLEWKDVDFERSRLTVLEAKNGESRAVHLPPSAVQALRSLKAASVVSARHVFLLPSGRPLAAGMLNKLWRAARAAAGLKNFRWHDLRHTAASYLAQNGATLHEVGSVLGHKSVGVTMKYAHLVQGAAVTGHDKLDQKLRGR